MLRPCTSSSSNLPFLPGFSYPIPESPYLCHCRILPTASVPATCCSLPSAKDRRKLRNEKREELKSSQKPWKETVDDLCTSVPLKHKRINWEDELNIGKLANLGIQWWGIRTFLGRDEEKIAQSLYSALRAEYPDEEFEVWTPMVPTCTTSRHGKTKKAFYRGHIFLKCTLTLAIHAFILRQPQIHGFEGSSISDNWKGWRRGMYSPVQLRKPTPFAVRHIEMLKKKVAEEETKFALEQEAAVLKANEKEDSGKRNDSALDIGTAIMVTSGAYANFPGTVVAVLPSGRLKVLLSVFGMETQIEIAAKDVKVNDYA